jgi:hypothetical protein
VAEFDLSAQKGCSMVSDEIWLREWEAIMRRIESIDARLWQGAGILIIVSIGGISLLGWDPVVTKGDFVFALGAGVFSILVLVIWWFIFHRWIHLQEVYSYRAREIETDLDLTLRWNTYASVLELWPSKKTVDLGKVKFEAKYPDAYERLQNFWKSQQKKRFGRRTIKSSLQLLNVILWLAWAAFIIIHAVGYFWPQFLGIL